MVEVFRTDIYDPRVAATVLRLIHSTFPAYSANFDLEDCDKILRVECRSGQIEAYRIIVLVSGLDHSIEILPDLRPILIPSL